MQRRDVIHFQAPGSVGLQSRRMRRQRAALVDLHWPCEPRVTAPGNCVTFRAQHGGEALPWPRSMCMAKKHVDFWLALLNCPNDVEQQLRYWNGYLAWKLPDEVKHAIRNVGHPAFNQFSQSNRLAGCARMGVAAVGGDRRPPPASRWTNAVLPHELGDRALRGAQAAGFQLGMDPRRAVAPLALLEDFPDPGPEPTVPFDGWKPDGIGVTFCHGKVSSMSNQLTDLRAPLKMPFSRTVGLESG